jgi:ubiquinone/menaquinone biosynthesis C-methylase UbiE
MDTDTSNLNPQQRQMAHGTIAGTLEAQARAIWPQELPLIERYRIRTTARILDAGCGTGEAASRLARHFPQAQVLGIDIIEQHLALARSRFEDLSPRLSFETRSVFDSKLPPHYFDLTVCRHVLQSIPQPARVISELARVTRPGGHLHLIVEDYGMIHFESRDRELQAFWRVVGDSFMAAHQTNMRLGRSIVHMLSETGLENIALDYVVVDTMRVPPATFAAILTGWRDGFSELTAQLTSIPLSDVVRFFDQMITQVSDPFSYTVWMVPVASARIPTLQ